MIKILSPLNPSFSSMENGFSPWIFQDESKYLESPKELGIRIAREVLRDLGLSSEKGKPEKPKAQIHVKASRKR
jgi:hypothetical protein